MADKLDVQYSPQNDGNGYGHSYVSRDPSQFATNDPSGKDITQYSLFELDLLAEINGQYKETVNQDGVPFNHIVFNNKTYTANFSAVDLNGNGDLSTNELVIAAVFARSDAVTGLSDAEKEKLLAFKKKQNINSSDAPEIPENHIKAAKAQIRSEGGNRNSVLYAPKDQVYRR